MEISIIKLMDKDHNKIKNILLDFEKEENKNFEKSKHVFSRFKWMLEKHFFIEEKIIFSSYEVESPEENEDLMKILKEHREILNLIAKSEDILFDEKKLDIEDLKHALLSHANYEDEIFYPKLDENLSQEQKLEIQNKIKDIILQ